MAKEKYKLNAPDIFGNKSLREKINFQTSDEDTKTAIRAEISGSINTAFEVLRSRIDKFGVTQPNIQRIGNSGRILIELPGAKDIERVKKLLQSTAELQFWEAYTNIEVGQYLYDAANAENSSCHEITRQIQTKTAVVKSTIYWERCKILYKHQKRQFRVY